ncbi:MAG: tRNA lysidine(34) synthetase TilS [Candidatus Omnitrophota bacterium]
MILDRIKQTIKKYNLINKGDKILVGVSGGPDSVTLLYLLNNLKKELNLTLHIAHLDHMLRKDSHKDRLFVEKLAGKLNLPISCAQINVEELSKHGSQEEIARNTRLSFFFRAAKQIKAKKIALGHNLDDQAETVLMRLLRGSGLYGLSGILPKRIIAGYEIIRPLIEIKRREIESFLKTRGIPARLDPSNLKDIYLRNRIRNNLLPLLEKEYNKNIKGVLSNFAESAGYDYDYLCTTAGKTAGRLGVKINIDKFLKLHIAIQRLVLRLNIKKTQGDIRRIDFQHIREIEDLILNRPKNSIVNLPKGVSVIKKESFFSFYKSISSLE